MFAGNPRWCLPLGLVVLLLLWAGCALRELNAPEQEQREENQPIPTSEPIDWEKTADLKGARILALIFSANGYLLAGSESGTVFRSKNRGDFWKERPLASRPILCFALDDDGVLYAGTAGEGIFLSLFNGKSWQASALRAGIVRALGILNDGSLLAGLANGLWRRSGSDQWESVPLPGAGTRSVNAIQSDGQRVFLGTDRGVFRSLDQAQNWEMVGLDQQEVLSLLIARDGLVLAATRYGGVFASRDGTAWSPRDTGLPQAEVFTMVVNHKNFLFIGTSQGVFYSTNDGEEWAPFQRGLPPGNVQALVLDEEDYLYAAVENLGVYRTIASTRFP